MSLHGYAATSEPDLVVYSVPDNNDQAIQRLTIDDLNDRIKINTQSCAVAIVQCKTNWNDNAQIPMLWDLVYRSVPFVNNTAMKLGRQGVSPRSFRNQSIKYAFMTVPTNSSITYRPGQVAVTRVLGLSGGNYWGKPTRPGIAAGFSDFLTANFSAHFDGSIQNHIKRQMSRDPELARRYLDLDFTPH